MPAIVGWIISGITSGVLWLFKNRIGQMITALLAWAGVSLATYKSAVEPFIDQLKSYAQSGLGGGQLGAIALQWAGLMKFDVAITMIISAVAAKHALNAARVFFRRAPTGS